MDFQARCAARHNLWKKRRFLVGDKKSGFKDEAKDGGSSIGGPPTKKQRVVKYWDPEDDDFDDDEVDLYDFGEDDDMAWAHDSEEEEIIRTRVAPESDWECRLCFKKHPQSFFRCTVCHTKWLPPTAERASDSTSPVTRSDSTGGETGVSTPDLSQSAHADYNVAMMENEIKQLPHKCLNIKRGLRTADDPLDVRIQCHRLVSCSTLPKQAVHEYLKTFHDDDKMKILRERLIKTGITTEYFPEFGGPTELPYMTGWDNVFRFLDTETKLKSTILVNRQWSQASRNPKSWICVQIPYRTLSSIPAAFGQRWSEILLLSIDHNWKKSEKLDFIQHLKLKKLKKLKQLSISIPSYHIAYDKVYQCMEDLPQVQGITLIETSYSVGAPQNEVMKLRTHDNLKVLRLKVRKVDESWKNFLDLPDLELLEIPFLVKFQDCDVSDTSTSNPTEFARKYDICTNIQVLGMSLPTLKCAMMIVQHCPQLRALFTDKLNKITLGAILGVCEEKQVVKHSTYSPGLRNLVFLSLQAQYATKPGFFRLIEHGVPKLAKLYLPTSGDPYDVSMVTEQFMSQGNGITRGSEKQKRAAKIRAGLELTLAGGCGLLDNVWQVRKWMDLCGDAVVNNVPIDRAFFGGRSVDEGDEEDD